MLMLLAYLGGVLTIISPCILPVLPFVFSRAAGPFMRNGVPLLAGMALTFALVSSLAAIGGGWAVHANAWGRWIALALLAVFALTLLFPALAEQLSRPAVALGNRLSQGAVARDTVGQSLLLGVATGLLWAPCAGPILGLILTISALDTGPASILLLFGYALGAATSLAVVLLAGRRAMGLFRRSRAAEEWTRRLLGVAVLAGVLAVAFGLDRGLLTRISAPQTTSLEQGLIARFSPEPSRRPPKIAADARPLAPDLAGGMAWLNGPPQTKVSLQGKVVVVDFWTYSCINCLRALPYVEAWSKRYADQGLVVVGVHTPEFAFEKEQANVEKAIRDFGVTYPVVMDNDRTIWKAFDNDSWPAHYFIDATGHIRGEHDGEGDYANSEQLIRTLLTERNGKAAPGGLTAVAAGGVQAAPDIANALSQERYLGYAKSDSFVSPGGLAKDQAKTYELPAKFGPDRWALSGSWRAGAEQVTGLQPGDRIAFQFHARDLHLVMGPASPGAAIHFRVRLDGKAPGADHGLDTDADGNGVIAGQRLYQLIRQRKVGEQDTLFEIEFTDPGAQVYAFTFG